MNEKPEVGQFIKIDKKHYRIVSVMPHITPYRRPDQTTKVEGYTLGLVYDDSHLKKKFNDFCYLAGNPYRTDLEDEQMKNIFKDLQGTDWEPEHEPAPRQPLPEGA